MKAAKIILTLLILLAVAAVVLTPELPVSSHDPVAVEIDSAPGYTARIFARMDTSQEQNLLGHIDPQADSYRVALAPGDYLVVDLDPQGVIIGSRILTVARENVSLSAPLTIPEPAPPEPESTEPPTTEPAPTEPDPAHPTPLPISQRVMPQYYQNDYPDTMYGTGSLEVNGCSITCLSMVASYMTGYTYTPDQLAGYFGGFNGNNIQRLENASTQLQLPWYKSGNWHETLTALSEGKIAIAMMNSQSYFTTGQHFIILEGFTEDGKILARDSSRPNYEHWALKPGFESGFDPWLIRQGYSGAWIYDTSQMTETPFFYYEEPHVPEYRYGDLTLTDEEWNLLARMVFVEAQGESDEGQQAVAEVVLNRMAAGNFPDTLRGVVYAAGQFKSVPYLADAEPSQTQYEAIYHALYGPYILPMDVVFFSQFAVNDNVWGEIGGHVFCHQWNSTD